MNTAATSEEAKKLKRTLEYELCRDLGAGDAAAALIDRCLKDARREVFDRAARLATKFACMTENPKDTRDLLLELAESFRALAAGEDNCNE